jgi:alpha-tubulin suppressor-like RCC1 family protein
MATAIVPVTVLGLDSGVAAVATGWFHTCALMDVAHIGAVKCWGYNYFGQLGQAPGASLTMPADVPGLSNIRAIAAGEKSYVRCDSQRRGQMLGLEHGRRTGQRDHFGKQHHAH